jgi:glycosyltransferase involved in cell wall biosynthesis
VDTDFFRPDEAGDTRSAPPFALVVSALVPYKQLEVAFEACRRVGISLKVAGDGPEGSALARRAGSSAEFLGRVTDEEVRALYRRAAVVLLPGEEDFGIVPLEAQACGRPVVALGRGGACETVIPGETGELVDSPSPQAFAAALETALHRRYDASRIRAHAERFGRDRFGDEIEALVRAHLAEAAA